MTRYHLNLIKPNTKNITRLKIEATITNLPGMAFSNWLTGYPVRTMVTDYKIRNWLFVYDIKVVHINLISSNIQFHVSVSE